MPYGAIAISKCAEEEDDVHDYVIRFINIQVFKNRGNSSIVPVFCVCDALENASAQRELLRSCTISSRSIKFIFLVRIVLYLSVSHTSWIRMSFGFRFRSTPWKKNRVVICGDPADNCTKALNVQTVCLIAEVAVSATVGVVDRPGWLTTPIETFHSICNLLGMTWSDTKR